MKTIVAAVVFCLLLLGLSPLYVGGKIESVLDEYVALYEDIPGYTVTLEEFDRGYLSSEATFHFDIAWEELGVPLDSDEILDSLPAWMRDGFSLAIQVGNGPILTRRGFSLGLMEIEGQIDARNFPVLESFLNQANIDYLISSYSQFGFDGEGWSEVDMPAIDTSFDLENEQLAVEFSGLDLHIDLTDFGMSGEGIAVIENLTLASDQGSVNMSGIAMDFSAQIEDNLYLANQEVHFQIASTTAPGFSFDNIEMAVRIEDGEADASKDIYVMYGVADAQGPGWQLEDAKLAMEMGNISNELLLAYYQYIPDMSAISDDESAEMEMQQAMLEEFFPSIIETLKNEPWFQIAPATFTWQEQEFDASLNLEFNESARNLAPNTSLPELLAWASGAVIVDVSMQADKSMAESILSAQFSGPPCAPGECDNQEEQIRAMLQARDYLDSLTQTGYLLDGGDFYLARAHMENGQLDINGALLNLPFLSN